MYRRGSRLSLRKAGILISYLPPESATATELRLAGAANVGTGPVRESEPEEDPWAKQELLIASLVDEMRWFRHEFRAANSKGGNAGPPPEQVPRPGVKSSRTRRKLYTQEQARMLDPRMRG